MVKFPSNGTILVRSYTHGTEPSLRIYGTRQPWTTIVPPDSAGVLYGNIVMTPDGQTSVYRYRRAITTLYLAEGLR